ncbi:low temperature requirement protein A [Actinomadura sp. HBU206391]|uniref:low temperature requirement protein A n=1 Tax=Actinomadura sp. HBU206391 TaxID=2731692 RepID=UPI0016507A3C|nr:low temperature requirement protein A [Actinomadura sp. HBU206391]MBC6457628.1 low temperature requirement protein A [Actinomadura sp. HBU206391]
MISPTRPVEDVYRVTTLELFFDLVFVFAVTQLTGVLADELSPLGVLQVVAMFGVMWWIYGGYAWLTNTLTPTTTTRRLLLLTGMAGFLIMALATPGAFKDTGVAWGIGYLIVVLVHAGLYVQGNSNILRVLPANLLAAALIIIAGLLDGAAVRVLWIAALLIPIAMPYIVPAGGRFLIQPTHIVERHGLLVIITLGETIMAIGIGAEGLTVDAELAMAAVLILALVAGLWWVYFDRDDERAEETLSAVDDGTRTQLTMFGYFYAHIPIVVGVIVMAAGVKKAVGHAWEPLHGGPAIALASGVALYLAGQVLFRRIMRIGPSRIRTAAVPVALATIPIGLWTAAAELVALTVVVAATLVAERLAATRAATAEARGVRRDDSDLRESGA